MCTNETNSKIDRLLSAVEGQAVAYDLNKIKEIMNEEGFDGIVGFNFRPVAFTFEFAHGGCSSYSYSEDGIKEFVSDYHQNSPTSLQKSNESKMLQIRTAMIGEHDCLSSILSVVNTLYSAMLLDAHKAEIDDARIEFAEDGVFSYGFSKTFVHKFNLSEEGLVDFVKMLNSPARIKFLSNFVSPAQQKQAIKVLSAISEEHIVVRTDQYFIIDIDDHDLSLCFDTESTTQILDKLANMVSLAERSLRTE
jgi:hypothetical protein